MAITTLKLTHTLPDFPASTGTDKPKEMLQEVANYFNGALSRVRDVTKLEISGASQRATATITLSTCVAGSVIFINGVRFTAVSGTPVVANNEFDISGDNTADATSLKNAINNCTSAGISGKFSASSSLGVVTITALDPGAVANSIPIEFLGVMASGTVTAASVQTGDTITINGVALTATQHHATETFTLSSCAVGAKATITTASGPIVFTAVASGANGINQFNQGGTDTQDAASLVTAINANPFLTGIITATSSAGVVTVRAVDSGTGGNSILLTANGSGILVFGSEDSVINLSGGVDPANNEFDFTGSNTQVATDIVRAINASSTALVSGQVVATSSSAVVTLRSKIEGAQGNTITLASSDGTRLAVTGARLTGGTTASAEGARATQTITISGADGGTYATTINGVTINATGSNGNDTTTAANVAAAVNSSTNALVQGIVFASSSSGTVTITAVKGGVSGNAITLSVTGTGATANGARLAGGAAPTTAVATAFTGGTTVSYVQ